MPQPTNTYAIAAAYHPGYMVPVDYNPYGTYPNIPYNTSNYQCTPLWDSKWSKQAWKSSWNVPASPLLATKLLFTTSEQPRAAKPSGVNIHQYNASLGSIVTLPDEEENRQLLCQSCKHQKHIITDHEKTIVDDQGMPRRISALGHPALIVDIIDGQTALVCIMSSKDHAQFKNGENTCLVSQAMSESSPSFDENVIYVEDTGRMKKDSFLQLSHIFAVPFANLRSCGPAFVNRITSQSYQRLMKNKLHLTPAAAWMTPEEIKKKGFIKKTAITQSKARDTSPDATSMLAKKKPFDFGVFTRLHNAQPNWKFECKTGEILSISDMARLSYASTFRKPPEFLNTPKSIPKANLSET